MTMEALFARDEFHARHIGPGADELQAMLAAMGCRSLDELVGQTLPGSIRSDDALAALPSALPEQAALAELKAVAGANQRWRSFIGCGYSGCFLPEAIRRNVLENPGWYTAYTPYQAEISQGRLEALLNFQQMVIDLTGLPVANASLLDEATAAAEAMAMIRRAVKSSAKRFFIDAATHPQVIAVMRTRARRLDIETVVGNAERELEPGAVFGAHLQNPDTRGRLADLSSAIHAVRAAGGMVSVGTDLLALLLIRSPGEMGADIAVGSAQRFGVPPGFGGPHAAFLAARQGLVRHMPGRVIGVSKDAAGHAALRMALQTREQHIRREKATSNICTAQALLATIAGLYAVWHGAEGLGRIALRSHFLARLVAVAAAGKDIAVLSDRFFDTVTFAVPDQGAVRRRAEASRINLRYHDDGAIGVAFDETTTLADVGDVAHALTGAPCDVEALAARVPVDAAVGDLRRTESVLTHPVFSRYRSESEFMRYLKRLENKDYSLVHGMIPLGSCTMKLNAAAEMAPVSWPEFAELHPFVPAPQAAGYARLIDELERWLADITGFDKVSFQPNSGAQGEYAGLMAIMNWHAARGEAQRDVCLIPASAHGTNPASAQMMGLRIVVVGCDARGNVDLDDLGRKIGAHPGRVAALMVTYPSTHGVFEEGIVEACRRVHETGGQVYMDGANLNALCGLAKPGRIGADVCHMNLHKTFCIPHGGGGPGMGPIAVAAHLAPHLPSHPFAPGAPLANGTVAAAPHGSALILAISWMYLRMMGAAGIRRATEVAILNANYIARRLAGHFEVLYAGANGRVAHECILDLRRFKAECGVTAEDVAKRLMDYGFHAPTLSFPVADTLMVEPTESESKAELDRFCDAMIAIRAEIEAVRTGALDAADNPLKNAPHTAEEIAGDWRHPYTREMAAFPLPAVRAAKFWPAVKRVDNAAGDRNFVCTCPPMAAYA
jgi:glycine dehydrogenase